jgi:hypothetical protein
MTMPRTATFAASLFSLALALGAAAPAHAGLITFGDTSTQDTDCTFSCGGRLQQDYRAAAFGSAPVTISRVSFFVESLDSTTVPLFDLLLATNANGSGLGKAMAANLGKDAANFATGPGVLGTPTRLDFYGSFAYDPRAGNLVLDVGTAVSLDGAFLVSQAVDRAYVWTGDGQVYLDRGYGIVTQFETLDRTPAAVPEPAGLLLFGAACAGMAGVRRRRRERRD